jgi:hypothetical protein
MVYISIVGRKRCFSWGTGVCAQCSSKVADGPINMAPLKKRKVL